MERQLSLPIYITAFLLSLLIFVVGVYIGHVIDTNNLNLLSGKVTNMSNRISSVNLLLLIDPSSSSCPIYLSELDSLDLEVELIGHRLAYLEDEKHVFDNDLKRSYFLLEAESLLLTKKVNSLCPNNRSLVLINFYSNKNCQSCFNQGMEILRARDELQSDLDIKLFSFDGDLASPVVESLKSTYNVSLYPTIVVENSTYSGFKTKSEIIQIIKGSK